ncbi:MAG TPA: glycosyltransferase family 1 protein [Bacteroidales bacterium]|nr:glycosyltransferase family 1 protein [Bacteroidales bacterium]
MKIAIEAQRIFRKHKHGMDFVVLELIKQIQRLDTRNEYFILVAPGPDRCLEETPNVHILEVKCPTYPLWEQWALPAALNKIRPDLVHCTSNTAPVQLNFPLVLTLHDIIYLEKRKRPSQSLYQNMGWYYRKWNVPKILSKCAKIITVSQFERNRIQHALNLNSDILTAIYNGVGAHFKPIPEPWYRTQRYIEAREYLFFLGNTDPKKNASGVFKAYDHYLKQSNKKLPLLIADLELGYVEGMLKQLNLMHLLPHLALPGYLSNLDLPSIYSGANVFLYPSLRESFGIPILEAMACGTPVITSNTSSMPEVAGPEACLVDPEQPIEIANQLLKIENDATYRNTIIQYGLHRAAQFSWEHTARSILNIYQEIYNKNKGI